MAEKLLATHSIIVRKVKINMSDATESTLIKNLLHNFPMKGKVEWIGVRPGRREAVSVIEFVTVCSEKGLIGDHFNGRPGAKRMVTLIQQEHIAVVEAILRKDSIDPALLRRNIVVSGINLLALKSQRFMIGTAVFEGTGPCPPCSRMEENLGPGGYNAMRGHGGLNATVIESGTFRAGDTLEVVHQQSG